MTSATNERSIAKAEDKRKEDARINIQVIQGLMSTQRGRRWVWLELEEAQMFSQDSVVDPYFMAFAKGKRVAGLRLLQSITIHAPAQYVKMTTENTGIKLDEESDDGTDDSSSD